MTRKQLKVALGVLAMISTTAALAFADCQKRINLQPTAAGAAIDASGRAEVRARQPVERFKVPIDAQVPDGTTFNVFVSNSAVQGGPFLAGTITIAAGAGELDINNNNGNVLPTGVSPVCSITTVEVRKADGTVLLSGSF